MKKEQQKKLKKETKKVKAEKSKSAEIKKSMQDAIKVLQGMNNIKGFIILVDNTDGLSEADKEKNGNGLRAIAGNAEVLANLFQNIPEDVMRGVKRVMELNLLKSSIGKLKDLVDNI